MTEGIGVLLVDDQQLVREGLHALLNLYPDIRVLGEAANGLEALEQVQKLQPQVVLMDVQMPEMDGIAAARRMREIGLKAAVIILTTFDDDEYVFGGLLAGAAGYLLKDTPSEQLAGAIRAAAEGKVFIHPDVTSKVVSELSRLTKRERVRHEQPLVDPLSQRELEVLALMAQGLSNKQIADQLFIAAGTLKNHVGSIYAKLGVHDRLQAARRAHELGLI